MAAGALGGINGADMPLTILSINLMGSQVVLSVTVATPILLVLIIGKVFYGEHVSGRAWAGCVLGAISVAVLACTGKH